MIIRLPDGLRPQFKIQNHAQNSIKVAKQPLSWKTKEAFQPLAAAADRRRPAVR